MKKMKILSDTCFSRKYLFAVLLIGSCLAIYGQERRHSSILTQILECPESPLYHIELINFYKGRKRASPQLVDNRPLSEEEKLNLYAECSHKQTQCLKPLSSHPQFGLDIQYRCIESTKITNMCARVAEFKRSPFDLFYASPSTQVKSCRCRIKGQFKIRVVDLRLLNNDDICSGTYINIQKLEGCPTPNNCFNKSFHCSEAAGTKMIHQKEVYYTGSNSAKLEISLVQLDSPPQMVWFRIIPDFGTATQVNCNTVIKDVTEAARTDKLVTEDDEGSNSLAIIVPVLAVLLLVAVCVIAFLLYRRRSRGIKKRTSGSSVKSTDSKHDENSITQDVNHNGHTEQMEHRVSEEYSTIEVINAETGVLDDQYYTIKEQKNAEYNVLNSNVPYVPDDPSYGHINKAADSNHKSESYIHIEPGTTKAISSRPRLEVPINVNEMKVGSDSRSGTQNDIKTKSNLNQFTPNETITADYSHLVQNCSGTPESNDRDSVIAKEDISGDTSLSDQRDIHDYFVLEQSQSDKSKEDANENRSNQYFLLEKTPFPDERGSASNKNAGNDEQKHSESPETKKDDRQISSKYESFDMQNHEHETEDCHEYTALENATRNKELAIALTGKTKTRNEKSSTKSENQSNEREDFSEQERIERERGHLKQGGALADRHDISQTSSENEDETIHDYFVLNKQV